MLSFSKLLRISPNTFKTKGCRPSTIAYRFASDRNSDRSEAITKVRHFNNPLSTKNPEPRYVSKSFPNIWLRNLVNSNLSKSQRNVAGSSFAVAFDHTQRREFPNQRIKKLTDLCGEDGDAYRKHFADFVRDGKVWPIVLMIEHIEETGVIEMKKMHINFLLTGCIAAKRPDLALQTILKYSDPDYVPNRARMKEPPALVDNSTTLSPHGRDMKNSLLGYQSFLSALIACGDNGEPLKVLTILKIMSMKGLPTTSECWNCAIHGYTKASNPKGAHDLFLRMHRYSEELRSAEAKRGSFVRVKADPNAAKDDLSEFIKFADVNLRSCNLVMKGYAKSGDFESTRSFFDSMEERYGFIPDSFSWTVLVEAAVSSEQMGDARTVLDAWLAMVKRGEDKGAISPSHMFIVIINGYIKKGDHRSVEELYKKMIFNDMTPDGYLYASLIKSAYASSNSDLADYFYKKMVAEKVHMSHSSWRTVTMPLNQGADHVGYIAAMDYYRQSGAQMTVQMWRDLIGIYGKQGMCQSALQALTDMQVIDKILPNQGCYLRVIRAYCETDCDWEMGLRLLRQTRSLGMLVGSTEWAYILEACVNSGSEGSDGRQHKAKKTIMMNQVFDLMADMEKVDNLVPNSFMWATIVTAFSARPDPSLDTNLNSPLENRQRMPHDDDLYFNYISQDKHRFRHESRLLQKFLAVCSTRNQENFFTEILRPLLMASLAIEQMPVVKPVRAVTSSTLFSGESALKHAKDFLTGNFRDNTDADKEDSDGLGAETSARPQERNVMLREMLSTDAVKVFELLIASASKSESNCSGVLRLCANIGDMETFQNALQYAHSQGIKLPLSETAELQLLTHYQNGDLRGGIDFGRAVLRRSDTLRRQRDEMGIQEHLDISSENDYNHDHGNAIVGEEYESHELRLGEIRAKVARDYSAPFLCTRNFFTILLLMSSDMVSPQDCLEFYTYMELHLEAEGEREREEDERGHIAKGENRDARRAYVLGRVERARSMENFLQVVSLSIVEAFVKKGQLQEAEVWAVQAIAAKAKRRDKVSNLHTELRNFDIATMSTDCNDGMEWKRKRESASEKKAREEQEASELLMPVLSVYLKGRRVDEMNSMLERCADCRIRVNHNLNMQLLMQLSSDGSASEVVRVITQCSSDAALSDSDKMSLWEAAFLGCLDSTRHNKMISNRDTEPYTWSESDSDDRSGENRRHKNRKTSLSTARAEQALWFLECMKESPGAPLPNMNCWSSIIRALCAGGRSDEAVDILQGLRSLEFRCTDTDTDNNNTNSETKTLTEIETEAKTETVVEVVKGSFFRFFTEPSASLSVPSDFAGTDLSSLWSPILVNRSDSGDLDGCLEILQVFRESSFTRDVSHWDKTIAAAVEVSKKKGKMSGRFISHTYRVEDLTGLLRMMIDTDGLKPSIGAVHKCLKHFGDLDNPVKVLAVLGIMKECDMPVGSRTFEVFEKMKRFDVVLDMYEDV